ncbi:PfkB family carbohydrate kinase [Roseibium sp.]|uniref:PfkB family carbohydrate kinase n=1 Tax=Roseibium sp. TaxID=1936156 RepID=UPI003A97FABF
MICFGAVHWDVIAHATRTIERETSTPAQLVQKPGGVATNVARALARLGIDTTLVGAVGADPAAGAIRSALAADGVRHWLQEQPGMATGQYLALHDPDGSLAAACIDDQVLAAAPSTFFEDAAKTAHEDALWFVDANLPPAVLASLIERAPAGRVCADAVSVAKVHRLSPILAKIGLLILNRAEAAELTCAHPDTSSEDLASALLAKGPKTVIITGGKAPLHARTKDLQLTLPTPKADINDVTGAGDALIAGTLAAVARGHDLAASLAAGQSAARLTLESHGAVSDHLSWQAVQPSP